MRDRPPASDPLLPHRAWLQTLLSDSRSVVAMLLAEPLCSVDVLRAQVLAYREQISAAPRADRTLGGQLVDGALALLERAGTSPVELDRRLAQVAVRYFVLDDDGDEDLLSPFGFDDDVEVFNAVVLRLGMEDLAIDFLS